MVIRYLRRPPRPRLGAQGTRGNREPSAAGAAGPAPVAHTAATAVGRDESVARARSGASGESAACTEATMTGVVRRAP